MAKILPKLQLWIKMANFLLDGQRGPPNICVHLEMVHCIPHFVLLCQSGRKKFTFYVVLEGATILLCPFLEPIRYHIFHQVWRVCKFSWVFVHFRPPKMCLFWKTKTQSFSYRYNRAFAQWSALALITTLLAQRTQLCCELVSTQNYTSGIKHINTDCPVRDITTD